MMNCPQCQTANQPENKFCRECGLSLHSAAVPSLTPATAQTVAEEDRTIPLPPTLASAAAIPLTPPSADEQVQIQERAAHLMAEATSLEQRGWYADATARAEKASALLPGALAPMSLLVGLYEVQGDRSRALALQEKIIRAYPDVPSENARAERLRQEARAARLAAAEVHSIKSILPHTSEVKSPDRADKPVPYLPLAVAGGVAALVFCAGLSLVGKRSNTPQITETTLPAANAPMSENAPSALGTSVNPGVSANPQLSPTEARPDPFARQGISTAPATPTPAFVPPTAPARRTAPTVSANPRGGSRMNTLPLPGQLATPGQVNNGAVRFVQPAPVTVVEGAPNGNGQRIIARPPTELAPGPNTSGIGAGTATGSAPTAPEDPGYIRIQVNPAPNPPANTAPPAGGGDTGPSNQEPGSVGASNNTSALSRARRMQDQGRYTEAISAYREAISGMTMPSGDAYQGLALSYQRNGNKVAARSGYQKAIRSYETEMSAGQRSAVAQRGLEACRAALEVLGG